MVYGDGSDSMFRGDGDDAGGSSSIGGSDCP